MTSVSSGRAVCPPGKSFPGTPAAKEIVVFLSNGATTNAIGNYSAAPEFFEYQATAPTILSRLIISLADTGNLVAGNYGATLTLTNGVKLGVYSASNTLITDFFPETVHFNAEFAKYSYDVSTLDFGSGSNYLVCRFSFNRFADGGVRINPGEKLAIVLEDNFTGLVEHEFCLQGYKL